MKVNYKSSKNSETDVVFALYNDNNDNDCNQENSNITINSNERNSETDTDKSMDSEWEITAISNQELGLDSAEKDHGQLAYSEEESD